MPRDLLNRIEDEIDARLRELNPLVSEYDRLTEARESLSDGAPAPERRARSTSRTASRRAGARQPRGGRAAGKGGGKRAPRGENRAKLLAVVEERPGVSVGEVAQATGIKKPIVYSTMYKLVETGEVAKTNLEGGLTGFRRLSGQE